MADYKVNIGAFQGDVAGADYKVNIGSDQADEVVSEEAAGKMTLNTGYWGS